MELAGKTIVITGAGRGIGRALAQHFARCGSDLALLDVNADDLAQSASLCAADGVSARCYPVSVADEAAVVGCLDRVVADFGRLDGLINNAGILRDALLLKVRDGEVVSRMSLAQWQSVIDVNLTGVFLCGREAAARMIGLARPGVIVNISSISRAGNIGQSNYSAAKAGVAALTVVWARELARHGIRVGAIAPGFIGTPMTEGMKPEALARAAASVPVGRIGLPEEIASTARFIFENEFFTGRCIEVDGGQRI